jgi:hypothetical protein
VRVSAWSRTSTDAVVRLEATITWEDREADDSTLWFEWPATLGHLIEPNADAALLAAYPLAMWFGERRLQLTGDVCPRLADGTRAAMALVAHRRPGLNAPTLEYEERRANAPVALSQRAAALCFSGGVDALFALHENSRTTSPDDPARFRFALFVFGLNTYDFDGATPRPARVAVYRAHADRLTTLATAHGITLVPVATNLRALFPSFDAWSAVAHDAPLAAMAHAMRGQVHSLAIASSGTGLAESLLRHEVMHAFHASRAVAIQVEQLMVTRLAKLRRLAAWPEGLAVLRVCLLIDLPVSGQINCGRCEKCIRTMLLLLIVGDGALARAPFPETDVSPDLIGAVPINSIYARHFYEEMSPALSAIGRHDLADAITRGLATPTAAPSADEVSTDRTWWQRLTT